MRIFGLVFLLIPLLAGCPKQQNTVPEALFGTWVHSHEEDTPEARVFRPHGFDFPPSRGREGFEIKANGDFIHYGIAPADGTLSREGKWVMEGGKTMKVSFAQGEPAGMEMELLEVSQDMLKIKNQ